MRAFTRRTALLASGAALGVAGTMAVRSSNPVLDGTRSIATPGATGILNDASELSATPIHRHVVLKDDPGEALVAAIRAEMAEAAAEGRPVNVGAARHSMGGQAIPRDGHALTYDNGRVELDSDTGTARVHAGARWSEVIAALDPAGRSPRVMQSNHDFGVAATFCVNAHGWPVKLGPMGSTVRAFEMIVPEGDVVTCSREENPDLFALTMGGYGLTGAITAMEIETAPNRRLEPAFEIVPAESFGDAFARALEDDTVDMAYGRLNVDRTDFMREALLITYRPTADQDDLPPASGSGTMARLASRIYRLQLGNERLKRWRWWSETGLAPRLAGSATRNSLVNEPVVTLDDRDPDRTDILHEYFVPPARFPDFLAVCRAIIPASYQEFLNVTLRWVETDAESLLSYAPGPRIAAVMSFSQEKTARAEADMIRMTRALVDGITGIGGTYYLPYRPHPTPEQFMRAYPRADAFAAAKRALDPGLLFRNALWERYLE